MQHTLTHEEVIDRARRLYVACQESGQWPGAQGAGFVGDVVEMPEWALRGV